jgi:hypothetical protein
MLDVCIDEDITLGYKAMLKIKLDDIYLRV